MTIARAGAGVRFAAAFLILVMAFGPEAAAQDAAKPATTSQDATKASKPPTPPDRESLLKGEGAGMGLYAEQHGYPGPKHVLDLREELKLTGKQKQAVEGIHAEMLQRAKELGKLIVKVEEELAESFKDRVPNEDTVEEAVEEIGRLRGRLRGVHLMAHVRTRAVLTPEQTAQYAKLRAKPATGK
jgi:Spy/CpxP family protein refolding chaperone